MWNHHLDKAWSFLTGFVRGGGWLISCTSYSYISTYTGIIILPTPNFMHFFQGGNPSSLPYPQVMGAHVSHDPWTLGGTSGGSGPRTGPDVSGDRITPIEKRHEVPAVSKGSQQPENWGTYELTMVMDTPDIPSIRCATQHTGTCRCFCRNFDTLPSSNFSKQFPRVSWIEGPSWGLIDSHKTTAWWLQSIWKIWIKTGIFPK